MRALAVPLLLLTALFTGCMEPQDQGGTDEDPSTLDVRERLLGSHPLPAPDGLRMHDWLEGFVAAHPQRITGTPNEEEATLRLAGELEDIGYQVEVMHFDAEVQGIEVPLGTLHAIVGTLPGTNQTDRWLAWGGHYDSVATTIEGAYDNGSGVALALELARMLQDVETDRTRAVLLFSGEEQGMLASTAYVSWYEQQDDFEIELFVGLDMVGIAYPAPGRPLAFFSGAAFGFDFVRLAQDVAWDLLGLPDDHESVTFTAENKRNSDEAQFERAGIATMRLAGLQTAGAYWGYHKVNDTMDTIHQMTGGPEHFQAGLENTAAMAYAMVLALDRTGVPEPAVG